MKRARSSQFFIGSLGGSSTATASGAPRPARLCRVFLAHGPGRERDIAQGPPGRAGKQAGRVFTLQAASCVEGMERRAPPGFGMGAPPPQQQMPAPPLEPWQLAGLPPYPVQHAATQQPQPAGAPGSFRPAGFDGAAPPQRPPLPHPQQQQQALEPWQQVDLGGGLFGAPQQQAQQAQAQGACFRLCLCLPGRPGALAVTPRQRLGHALGLRLCLVECAGSCDRSTIP